MGGFFYIRTPGILHERVVGGSPVSDRSGRRYSRRFSAWNAYALSAVIVVASL